MRILLCHNFYQRAGGEDVVYADEAWMLESKGHQVSCFSVHNDSVNEMSRFDLIKKTFWNSQIYSEIQQRIRQFRPDVMHCTNTFPLISPSICHAAARENVAVLMGLHNYRLFCPSAVLLRDGKVCESCIGKSFAWPAIAHKCYRDSRSATAVVAGMLTYHRYLKTWSKAVDRFIATSNVVRDKYVQAGFNPKQFSVKPNFLRPDPGIGPGDGGYAVFVGRLSTEKGIDSMLDAWKGMKNDIPLIIVGDGPMADLVRQAAESDSRIQWIGQQPLDEVCRVIGKARCLVMPSIWHEPFGRTVIEAFAVGTPVIAARIGAMQELVCEGRTGLFFEPGNGKDLARAVTQVFQDPHYLEKRSLARNEYVEKFTAETNYEQLMRIYNSAIESKHNKNDRKAVNPESLDTSQSTF